jgi:hypothetical protein
MSAQRLAWLAVALWLLPAAAAAEMDLNGVVATENFIGVRDGEFFDFRNANWFQLRIQAEPHNQVRARANLELRNTNFTQVDTIDELWDRGRVEPISWRINEAYMDLYGFLLDTDWALLDLRVGKQVLAWGEADGFNPTNKFDPLDLENPHDFKEKLGNVALKATVYAGADLFSIEGVVVPRFLPSVLPVDLFLGDDVLNNPLMPSFDMAAMGQGLPPGFESYTLQLEQPGYQVLNTRNPAARVQGIMGGARIRWALWGFDWTISYARARESIPVPKRVEASAELVAADDPGCADEDGCISLAFDDVELIYPWVHVLGFNLRGSIWDIGVWGEAALIFPQGVELATVARDPLGNELPVPGLTSIDDEPYTKWVLGAEYTFSGGYFVNLQWVHGFFVELSGHKLHDYLFLVFRKAWLADTLELEINLGGELDHNRGRDALGWLFNTQLSYAPYDGSKIVLGYLMSRGEAGTTFDMFEQLDQAYLKFRVDF